MSVQIGKGPAYRSYSSFTAWLHCGKQWELQRIAGMTEDPSCWLAGGKAVHSAAEDFDHLLYEAEGR